MKEDFNNASFISLNKRDDVSQFILDETHSVVFFFDVSNELMEVSFTTLIGERRKFTYPFYFSSDVFRSRIHPDFRDSFVNFVKQVIEAQQKESFDYLCDYNDNGYSWYRAVFKSLIDTETQNQYLVGFSHIIEKEKHAERVFAETDSIDISDNVDMLAFARINVTKRNIEEYHIFYGKKMLMKDLPFKKEVMEDIFSVIVDSKQREYSFLCHSRKL